MKIINLHTNEKKLIAQAIDQNRSAQQQLYSKFSPKMLSVCRQYISDLHQAEDVMITAFMKVFVNLEKFEHKGSFEGWIRRIMINECISFLRVHKAVKFIDDQNFVEEQTIESNCELTLEQLQDLIDELPTGYKMVFNLYVIDGYKHREIGEMLQINEGTSKSQLAQARRILQEKIIHLNRRKNEA